MYYGNVAVKQETVPQRKKAKKVVRVKRGISMQEKLLYLFIVVLLVCISASVLTRYAQISQYNYEIQTLTQKIERYEEQNLELGSKIEQLKNRERILSIAEKQGLKPVNKNVIYVGAPYAYQDQGDGHAGN